MTSPSFSPDAVRRLARLARLSVTDADVARLSRELEPILAHVRALGAVDTDGVAPTAHVSVDRLPLRPDERAEELDRELVLGEAPARAPEGFVVPAFVDEG
ncbi:MAG: Asp-tRNA(Asn)/Glu-tRNA(Gln) amidotransferase subunit GatC [Polyangiaceae bacterium]|nr:Asp-tRNA(Asn)/Glu-tRNA(Gln) amidotransferase subunit GatC [Polyangiaceae bacterium]